MKVVIEPDGINSFGPACRPLSGEIELPGDKSISHRAAIIAAISEGVSFIRNYSPGLDCASTISCLRKVGVDIRTDEQPNLIEVSGVGLFGLKEPSSVLDAGNSGTTMRLLTGILAGSKFFSVVAGDESLMNRPMGRVVEPLRVMGANICGRNNGSLGPLSINGKRLKGTAHNISTRSAQVKSCLLLAGLLADGETIITMTDYTRDHTERLLRFANVDVYEKDFTYKIGTNGCNRDPEAFSIDVPGDISSAAFLLGAAAILEGSSIKCINVGLNPSRTGYVHALKKMGAEIEIDEHNKNDFEPFGDIYLGHSKLRGIRLSPLETSAMIDEIPVLTVIATQASSKSIIEGVDELKVKESDRLHSLIYGLRSMGANIEYVADSIIVYPSKLTGAQVASYDDHRMAMAFRIASLVAFGTTTINGYGSIAVSYPGFENDLERLMIRGKKE